MGTINAAVAALASQSTGGTGGSTRTFRGSVANQAAMLALPTVNVGDWVIRTDLAQVFELTTAGPATLANWTAEPLGGASTFSALTDKLSAPIATENTSVANALATKPDILAPVTLTGATTLTRALHGNRQLLYSGANATLTVATDAVGLWLTDDGVETSTLTASAGVPTLAFPDGKTITGSATKIIGGTRKGADSWTAGTTDPAATGGVQTGIQKPWAASGASIASPADLLDNVLLAVALPALGPNAVVTFEFIGTGNGVGSKTRKVSLSNTATVGTTVYSRANTDPIVVGKAMIRNRNSAAAQYGNSGNILNDDGYGSAGAAGSLYTAAIDTSVAGKFLVFSVQKATAADLFSLEHYCITIFDPAAV